MKLITAMACGIQSKRLQTITNELAQAMAALSEELACPNGLPKLPDYWEPLRRTGLTIASILAAISSAGMRLGV